MDKKYIIDKFINSSLGKLIIKNIEQLSENEFVLTTIFNIENEPYKFEINNNNFDSIFPPIRIIKEYDAGLFYLNKESGIKEYEVFSFIIKAYWKEKIRYYLNKNYETNKEIKFKEFKYILPINIEKEYPITEQIDFEEDIELKNEVTKLLKLKEVGYIEIFPIKYKHPKSNTFFEYKDFKYYIIKFNTLKFNNLYIPNLIILLQWNGAQFTYYIIYDEDIKWNKDFCFLLKCIDELVIYSFKKTKLFNSMQRIYLTDSFSYFINPISSLPKTFIYDTYKLLYIFYNQKEMEIINTALKLKWYEFFI